MDRSIRDDILQQVQRNCLISDSGYWGYYSTCGLLLRLREQYRFEAGIPPGAPVDIKAVGPWIEKRESEWQRLESEPLRDISIGERVFSPFDAAGINAAIEGSGLVYGGGHGVYMKPVFFMAELDDKRAMGPFTVLMAGRELARDLSIHPALSREGVIIARSDMAHSMIRERFEEFRAARHRSSLVRAFSAYGLTPDSDEAAVMEVSSSELQCYIHHEFGELVESERLGPDWAGLMEALGTSRTGLDLRGVKDALADTAQEGMLAHIIREGKAGSLFFYTASLTGIRYTLSSAVREAAALFSESGGWAAVEEARRTSYAAASAVAEEALDVFRDADPAKLEADIKAALARACPMKT